MRPEASLVHRRKVLIGSLALSAGLTTTAAWADSALERLRAIEASTGGRLGFWAGQYGGGSVVQWRSSERFLMCSTFKALAVAAALSRVDHGQERLDRWIPYGQKDLLDYAPVTKANLAKGGMALGDLCAAAIELSDNTAANLILASLGGPAGVTLYVRSLGDDITRLDRSEPELNRGEPGELRDTTTPASMAGLWRKLLLQDVLSTASRDRLNAWLEACQTGGARLKAATPKGWRIGHKTGSGSTTIGDVAIMTPPGRPPILIAVYLNVAGASSNPHDEAIAEAARLALSILVPNT
ncbi:MAG TPA: class A beta-lactamase [Caulobacteraceae bacterium]|jgi:beta-lactamase class A